MVEVKFYDPDYNSGNRLIYSVIAARNRGKWIFVRHRDRITWEIPGGHIEEEETPFQAAARELKEETGAILFSLICVATYSVKSDRGTGWGRLFFAEVNEIGPVNDISEIAEVIFDLNMPEALTYPEIQPLLLAHVIRYIQGLPS